MFLAKEDLIQGFFSANSSDNRQAIRLPESLFQILKKIFEDGEDIPISDFGNSYVKQKNE